MHRLKLLLSSYNWAVFALKASLTHLFIKYHGFLTVTNTGCLVVVVQLERSYRNVFVLVKVDQNVDVFLIGELYDEFIFLVHIYSSSTFMNDAINNPFVNPEAFGNSFCVPYPVNPQLLPVLPSWHLLNLSLLYFHWVCTSLGLNIFQVDYYVIGLLVIVD